MHSVITSCSAQHHSIQFRYDQLNHDIILLRVVTLASPSLTNKPGAAVLLLFFKVWKDLIMIFHNSFFLLCRFDSGLTWERETISRPHWCVEFEVYTWTFPRDVKIGLVVCKGVTILCVTERLLLMNIVFLLEFCFWDLSRYFPIFPKGLSYACKSCQTVPLMYIFVMLLKTYVDIISWN